MEIEDWYKYEELISKVKLIVVNRKTEYKDTIEEKIKRYAKDGVEVKFVKIPNLEISSSYIREEFKEKRDPKYYIPKASYDYIKQRGLYD